MQAIAGHNALILLCTAYVTDLISPRNRAPALALNMAAFSVAFALGPGIGGAVGTVLASLLMMGGVLFTLLLLLVFVAESLSPDARMKVTPCQTLSKHKFNFAFPCTALDEAVALLLLPLPLQTTICPVTFVSCLRQLPEATESIKPAL